MSYILGPPPFDPENLLKIRYDYDPLAKIIEYLLQRDKEVSAFMQSIRNNPSFYEYFNSAVSPNRDKARPNETESKNEKSDSENVAITDDKRGTQSEEKKEDQDAQEQIQENPQNIKSSHQSSEDKEEAKGDSKSESKESSEEETEQHEKLPAGSGRRYKVEKVVTSKPIDVERELANSDIIREMRERIENLERIVQQLNAPKKVIEEAEELPKPIEKVKEAEAETKEPIESPEAKPESPAIETTKDEQREVVVERFDSSRLERNINANAREIGMLKELLKDLEKELKKSRSVSQTNVIEVSQPAPIPDSSEALAELREKISQLEKQVRELFGLYKKIDMSRIERELTYLGQGMSQIKELRESLGHKVNPEQLEKTDERVHFLEEALEKYRDDIGGVNEEMEKYKQSLELYNSKLAYIAKIVSELQGKAPAQTESSQKYDSERLDQAFITDTEWNQMKTTVFQLNKAVPEVIDEVEKLRELKKLYNSLLVLLEQKMDKRDFEAWKTENNLQEIIAEFAAHYVERTECRKELEKVRRRIAGLESSFAQEDVKEGEGEKAMIARKGLGGWSCAACAKNLTNLAGRKATYYSWAKLPTNVGKLSYSRMLEMLKPEDGFRSQRGGKSVFRSMHESASDCEPLKEEENLI
eukprot:TRINITY_DN4261_c0_g2_i4.p1 TRINITY_DN4261_c0_g2~~TRINITY_DN4261_c0_g2_i4.p1  ORF type:complete len:645 (-),score=217.86 TRINITY_DN4261_c0_g2_i4:114-2048(-)